MCADRVVEFRVPRPASAAETAVPLWRRLCHQAGIDLWAATAGVLVNSVLGSALAPRPVRWLGYRALGMRVRTPNIFPGLRVSGSPRNISIGGGTFLNSECFLEAVAEVSIGRGCQFGPQVMIVTSHHSRTPEGVVSKVPEPRPVRIGDRVWLGARVTVLPGVTIGDDVVIGAGAVVAKDCPRAGLYAGVPARWVDRSG